MHAPVQGANVPWGPSHCLAPQCSSAATAVPSALACFWCAAMLVKSWLNLHSSPRWHCPLRKSKQMPRSCELIVTMSAMSCEYLHVSPRVHTPFVKSKHIWLLGSTPPLPTEVVGDAPRSWSNG